MLSRKKHGCGFSYFKDDGERLDDKNPQDRQLRAWIKSLVIPPAWTEVKIDEDKSAKIHAYGRDANGKKQYIYNAKWAKRRQEEKYDRLETFVSCLPAMRKITTEHLSQADFSREKVLACMLRLIDIAYFRPGNSQYTQQNESYGLTTLRSRHLHIEDNALIFRYQGKSKVEQEKKVENALLAKVVAELDELPGYRIFKYMDEDGKKRYVDSDDLNPYIREVMDDDFSAKDFRTWAGTSLAAIHLDTLGHAGDKKKLDKNIVTCVKYVAEKLGNTPAICRANYISPRILSHYENGITLGKLKPGRRAKELDELSEEEFRVLKLLQLK